KADELPPLSETLVEPDADDPKATILELDELWSFVMKKVNKSWIWIALCRKTRQVVARAVGDRSQETCRELWNNIPEVYRKGHCYSDFWAAYQAVICSASNIQQWAKKQVKQLMSSAGIIHCGSVWEDLFAK